MKAVLTFHRRNTSRLHVSQTNSCLLCLLQTGAVLVSGGAVGHLLQNLWDGGDASDPDPTQRQERRPGVRGYPGTKVTLLRLTAATSSWLSSWALCLCCRVWAGGGRIRQARQRFHSQHSSSDPVWSRSDSTGSTQTSALTQLLTSHWWLKDSPVRQDWSNRAWSEQIRSRNLW